MLDLGEKYLLHHTQGHWRSGAMLNLTAAMFEGSKLSAVRLNYSSHEKLNLIFNFFKIIKHETF
jgi:hypothetical protein